MEFQLKRNNENYRDAVTITSETTDHKAVWENLPKADQSRTDYSYTVVETVKIGSVTLIAGTDYTAGAWSSSTSGSTTTWTINNEMIPVSVSGGKTWYDKDATTTHNNASEITLTLTRTSDNVTTLQTVTYDAATQLSWSGNT
ncbi:MAG: Cna B-type domain-containing protein, partial [Clostridia bacterium]|nr:Cna B-type domain-containing protein [Clostridia bacterium]